MALPTDHKYTPVSHNVLDEAVTLDEGFITPISSVDTPPSSAHAYLEVVAPATLPEGYAFEAEVKGETFTVRVVSAMFGSVCVFVLLVAHIKHTFVSTVVCIAHYQPLGGVEEGQKFSVPFSAGSRGYSGAAVPRVSVPVGHWKDGIVLRGMLCIRNMPSSTMEFILLSSRPCWPSNEPSKTHMDCK
jgi:hypothetical protein